MQPIYNQATQRHISRFREHLPHALLITGESGAGLMTAAKDLAAKDLAFCVTPLTKTGEQNQITGIISVERIRDLYDLTKGKTHKRRVVIIDDADRMNEAAQNAFLKLLEEPTGSTHFILTSHTPEKLLPTITSRVQHLRIGKLSASQTATLLTTVGDAKKKTQLLFLAEGLPAEIHRLLNDERYFETQSQLVRDAHLFIGGDRYTRITKAFAYAGNRDNALQLLTVAKMLLKRTLAHNPSPETITRAELVAETIKRINGQANVRIQLLRLVV